MINNECVHIVIIAIGLHDIGEFVSGQLVDS